MKVTKKKFELAVVEEIISHGQAEKLFDFLSALPSTGPRFDFITWAG